MCVSVSGMGDEPQRKAPARPYVIPALRSAQKQQLPSSLQREPQETDAATEEETTEHPLTNSLENLSLNLKSSSPSVMAAAVPHHPSSPPPSSEDYLSCCLLVFGFSSSLPIETKERLLSPFYLHSAKSQWLHQQTGETETVALFAYSSSQRATLAFREGSSQLPPPLHAVLLTEAPPDLRTEAEAAARELVASFKPEIDSRVANRMITAALGLRRPAAAAAPARTQRTKPAQRAPSPPRTDAWDD
jgi:hypothetical protein